MKTPLCVTSMALLLAATAASSAPLPEGPLPHPISRPQNFQNAAVPAPEITGSIPRATVPQESDSSLTMLKQGLDALSNRDASAALSARDALTAGSLDHHLMTWAIATSGLRGVPSSEIAQAQRELTGWPGLSRLRANSERALFAENPPAAQVLAAFGNTAPETVQGAIILARAHEEQGNGVNAARILRPFWIGYPLDKDLEDQILREFGSVMSVGDHRDRMDYLMYRGRTAQAQRFSELGKAASLYKAWSAVAANAKNSAALLASVDRSLQEDPAYLFARIEYLRRQDQYAQAAALLERAPKDRGEMVNSAEWWNERRIIARGLADQDNYSAAYRIVASHNAKSATDIVDAEFHAGWYALRGMKDTAKASQHFERILKASTRPLSASRAWYWLGRSAEAGGPGNAADYFSKAAGYPATFYGQLAAARLKLPALTVSYPSPSNQDRRLFESREAVRAIDRLDQAGHAKRADALYKALADEMNSPGELAILAARAERNNSHAVSLEIGKSAFNRGLDVAALAFPLGVIPTSADINGSGKALAYSIARQESAFNPAAISGADARGLLQLLPGTAKAVAARHGMPFTAAKLTSDPGYNATLGAHYLGEQIDAFDGSYIMTFIAYNAGPRRVPEWIARYGDPRRKNIDDVVDWIERIPFPETRNYVQRVMENYQVYKVRLGQKTDIVSDLRFGRER